MKELEQLLVRLNKLDINDIFKTKVWARSDSKEYIIALNTEGETTSQLYNLGVDSLGQTLGQYTPYTKQAKSTGSGDKRIDHITLKDTGEFYESFRVIPTNKGFNIIANPNKDGDNLFDDFGEEIVGLTKENEKLMLEFVEEFFENELEKRLFQ